MFPFRPKTESDHPRQDQVCKATIRRVTCYQEAMKLSDYSYGSHIRYIHTNIRSAGEGGGGCNSEIGECRREHSLARWSAWITYSHFSLGLLLPHLTSTLSSWMTLTRSYSPHITRPNHRSLILSPISVLLGDPTYVSQHAHLCNLHPGFLPLIRAHGSMNVCLWEINYP